MPRGESPGDRLDKRPVRIDEDADGRDEGRQCADDGLRAWNSMLRGLGG